MSLNDFKKNLEKIRSLSEDYGKLMKEKEKIELDLRNLKAKYRENQVERDVFSEYNKNLKKVMRDLGELREEVMKLCEKNSGIIGEELKDVF